MPNLSAVSLPDLSLEPTTLVFVLALIATILLYLREYNLRKRLQSQGDKFLEKLKEKGWNTLHTSIKKSQEVLGQAELEGIKAVAENKMELHKLDEQYANNLNEALNESRKNITAAQAALLQFMQDLQKRSEEFEEAQKTAGEQRINQLFDRVENRLSDFLVATEQKTTSSIELELKAARQMVDAYKNEQLKLINENILAMMEQTLATVLGKKLSLKDQMDLVYEALEKAKVEKFIV